jgi:hypothetical protein
MNKIYTLGKCIFAYLKRYGNSRPPLTFTCETESCNHRAMHKHGRYFRMAVTKHHHIKIPAYRWRCCICKTTLTVLPDFLVPGKHFVTFVREAGMKRKAQGEGFERVAKGVVSPSAGGISPRTIKRWWTDHLHQAGEVAHFIAGELIKSGVEEDLLSSHSHGVNPTPVDTVRWFARLIPRYIQVLGLGLSFRMGSFGFLNTRLSPHLRI